MNWHSFAAFMEMGGYADYVWGSYAMAVLCIILEIALLLKRYRKLPR